MIERVTIEELEHAYKIAANVVAIYGDAYLPAFKRLHNELEKLNEETQVKKIALQVASATIEHDSKG